MDNKRNTDLRDVGYYLFSAEVTKDKVNSLRKDQLIYIIIALIIGFLTYISNALILGGFTFILLLYFMIRREITIYDYKKTLYSQIILIEENINLLISDNLSVEGNTIKARLKILKDN